MTDENKISRKTLLYDNKNNKKIIPFDDFEYSLEYKKLDRNIDNLIEIFNHKNKIIQNEHMLYLVQYQK